MVCREETVMMKNEFRRELCGHERKRTFDGAAAQGCLAYVLPAMAAMVLDGIQGIVDGLFLGNFVGADAMASVNIANPYFQVIIGGSMIICTGTMSAVEEPWGQEMENGQRIFIIPLCWYCWGSHWRFLWPEFWGRPLWPVFWERTKFCRRDPNSISIPWLFLLR